MENEDIELMSDIRDDVEDSMHVRVMGWAERLQMNR